MYPVIPPQGMDLKRPESSPENKAETGMVSTSCFCSLIESFATRTTGKYRPGVLLATVEDSRIVILQLHPALEFPGLLAKMQILIQQAGTGPENFHF